MVPPNLRQDWLRNSLLLLGVFVALIAFSIWTLYRMFVGGAPAIGGLDAVPMEPLTVAPSAPVPAAAVGVAGPEGAAAPVDPEAALVEPPPDAVVPDPARLIPDPAAAPRFPAQAGEAPETFVVEAVEGLGASFVRRAAWRRAAVSFDEGDAAHQADVDLVLEAPDAGSRLALSAWNAGERAPFELWVLSVAGGMRSVDGQYPTNAVIGALPALIVGDPESPITPVRYAAFLDRGTHYVRLAWSGGGASADPYDFARALVTLAWDDTLEADGGADTVPALDLPSGLYYPSEQLFPW